MNIYIKNLLIIMTGVIIFGCSNRSDSIKNNMILTTNFWNVVRDGFCHRDCKWYADKFHIINIDGPAVYFAQGDDAKIVGVIWHSEYEHVLGRDFQELGLLRLIKSWRIYLGSNRDLILARSRDNWVIVLSIVSDFITIDEAEAALEKILLEVRKISDPRAPGSNPTEIAPKSPATPSTPTLPSPTAPAPKAP